MSDLFADLEEMFAAVDAEEIVNVKALTNPELLDIIQDLTQELMAMQQAIKPRSQEARDKHSLRNACQVELRERGFSV